MKSVAFSVFLSWASGLVPAYAQGNLESYFTCKDLGAGAYRPYYLKAVDDGSRYLDYSQTHKGLLGQNKMRSREECERATEAANHEYGIVCSRTGLDGWKPTIYTGTVPGRADFGYMGGSSIMDFADCLTATRNSGPAGVCFWGGSDWYVSPIDRAGTVKGPYRSIDQCITVTSSF